MEMWICWKSTYSLFLVTKLKMNFSILKILKTSFNKKSENTFFGFKIYSIANIRYKFKNSNYQFISGTEIIIKRKISITRLQTFYIMKNNENTFFEYKIFPMANIRYKTKNKSIVFNFKDLKILYDKK